MQSIRDAAYRASVDLARERGPFEAFAAPEYLTRPFILRLPAGIQAEIRRDGIRNSHLLAVAPAGAISLLTGNVSSGIEPIFGIETLRRLRAGDGTYRNFQVTDHAYALWRASHPGQQRVPEVFIDREAVSARDHLLMQAALQPYVDGAIAKTTALAQDASAADVAEILQSAYDLHVKGCTVEREGARRALAERRWPLEAEREAELSTACCGIERENE